MTITVTDELRDLIRDEVARALFRAQHQAKDAEPEFLSLAQSARALGMCEKSIYNYVVRGAFPPPAEVDGVFGYPRDMIPALVERKAAWLRERWKARAVRDGRESRPRVRTGRPRGRPRKHPAAPAASANP